MRLISAVKVLFVPAGCHPRTVRFGIYRGLRLEIDLASKTQVYMGLWERETYQVIRKAAAKCVWAIDVGAGQGELCLFLLCRSRAQKIYAFEPQQSEIDIFLRNLKLNGASSTGRLSMASKFVGCSAAAGYVSLDSLDLDRQERGFLKIDVDGAELDVLRSGESLLRTATVDILVEAHSRRLETDCSDFLAGLGFRCEVIDKAWWRTIVPEQRPIEHNRWLWATKR